MEVLKELQLENGGILATPQNGAYPYVYPRDAVIITKAMNHIGMYKDSERFYNFLKHNARISHYKEIFHRYTMEGLPAVTRKHEHDNNGLVLHGIWETYKAGKNESFLQEQWDFVEGIVDSILASVKLGVVHTERSIHEFYRLECGQEIWSHCACTRGMKDAIEIAKVLGHKDKISFWSKKIKLMEKKLWDVFYEKKLGMFLKNKKVFTYDISQIAPFYFELVNDLRILRKSMRELYKHLWNQEVGGFRRFRKFEVCKDWHWYSGGSGGWCVYTIWAAKFYKKLGDPKEKKCLEWLGNILNSTKGLLPEHVALIKEYELWKENELEYNSRVLQEMKKIEKYCKNRKCEKVYWALPLGWSHAEYLLIN